MAHIDNSDLIFLEVIRENEKADEFEALMPPMMPAETRLADAGYLTAKSGLIRTTLKGKARMFLLKRLGR
jgi:hypothetical protein